MKSHRESRLQLSHFITLISVYESSSVRRRRRSASAAIPLAVTPLHTFSSIIDDYGLQLHFDVALSAPEVDVVGSALWRMIAMSAAFNAG